MWLLESEAAFQGRKLWLRPGKRYLFGRTVAEAGQLVVSHQTVSRKHLTIEVAPVAEGQSHNVSRRSGIVLEDLATKLGTTIDGQRIKGSKYVVSKDETEILMARCPEKFRLRWVPVVFTFSFTNKELQTQPMQSLRKRFEQLDIKLLEDYHAQYTSHVISKKRNTAKGLQALINGKYIVTESFLDAVAKVAGADEENLSDSTLLEQDFDRYWPQAMEHLPPRGGEPVQFPDDIYAPDIERKTVFEGYTFIFYDQTQYRNLLAPITSGSGKALLRAVQARETTVDDFVRYVKEVAGEKGLGSFDDGSEGRGVVLVRFLPAKGDLVGWYTEFLTNVSLRLDHRPIEQNEFLEAILIKNASKLRRPLEVESSMGDSIPPQRQHPRPNPGLPSGDEVADSQPPPAPAPLPRRGGPQQPATKRFPGFDSGDDNFDSEDDDDAVMDDRENALAFAAQPPRSGVNQPSQEEETSLFVCQEPDAPSPMVDGRTRSQRKRRIERIPEDNLMEGIAPAVAKFKKQRLDGAFASASASASAEREQYASDSTLPTAEKSKPKKARAELDVLALAAKNREDAEARARAEQEDLAILPEDIDLSEIRRLNIVEEMDVRTPRGLYHHRTRDQEISDGRWNPKWNGVKNFKKFRRRGEATGRQPARVIVALTEVRNKEFGVGDSYWLEDEDAAGGNSRTRGSVRALLEMPQAVAKEAPRQSNRNISAADSTGDDVMVDDDDDTALDADLPSRSATLRGGRGRGVDNSAKRAVEDLESRNAPPAKRPRPVIEIGLGDSDDDSDDELKFRWGARR